MGEPTLDFLSYKMIMNYRKLGGVGMNRGNLLKMVNEISVEIAEELGFELVDLEYVKESGNYFLRVYIDKIDGVSLDDCEKMSAKLGKELDEKDPIRDPYYLEVSSPGLDRPLKTDSDLKRNLNKDIEISLYRAFNNEKNYEGKLIDFNEKEILITDDDNNISIPREYIANIKLAIKF